MAIKQSNSRWGPVRSGVFRLGAGTLGLGVLGALVGLGAAASAPTGGRPSATVLAVILRVLLYLGLALEVVIGTALVYALWPQRRRGKRKPEDEWEEYHEPLRLHWAIKLAMLVTPLALLIGLVAVALHVAHGGGATLPGAQPLLGPNVPRTTTPLGASQAGRDTSLVALEITIGILGLAAGIALFLLRRRPNPISQPGRVARAVAAAVDDGLEALRRERDPRRAVVLAHAAMERALARRGWPRAEADAPFEYLERLTGAAGVGRTHLHGLTELFEVARFSDHPVDEVMRAAAVAHLESVRADLEAAPSTA